MSASSINPDLLASIAKKFKIESPNEVEQRGAQSDSRKIHEGLLKLKDVAVKTLDYRRSKRSKPEDEVTLEETFRRRLREAEIWCKLRHPNILSFLGYTHAVDGIQLLSPWCENGSLIEYYTKQYQKKNINVPPEKRFHLLLDVARGLKYLHTGMQVYHGDLKGSNILIDRHGDALLCDFEHSIDVGTSDGLQSVRRGTTQYNSPELIGLKEGQIDVDVLTQSDVWAFGCTAIEASPY
ncbi:hypothetical protein FRC03_011324 [Tulasnella sp. 419]|nr:hypothetical protein FRC03_011324 [Tulasnella sp. 419]